MKNIINYNDKFLADRIMLRTKRTTYMQIFKNSSFRNPDFHVGVKNVLKILNLKCQTISQSHNVANEKIKTLSKFERH